jgi:hypothetical protein
MLRCLQNNYLYYRTQDNSFEGVMPKIAQSLSNFLSSYFDSLPTDELRINFIERLTFLISTYTWNATCLFFLCKSIHDIKNIGLYTSSSSSSSSSSENEIKSSALITNFIKIIKCSLSTQELMLRSATQSMLINAVVRWIKVLSYSLIIIIIVIVVVVVVSSNI